MSSTLTNPERKLLVALARASVVDVADGVSSGRGAFGGRLLRTLLHGESPADYPLQRGSNYEQAQAILERLIDAVENGLESEYPEYP